MGSGTAGGVRQPTRLRAARANLLGANAARLLTQVSSVFCEPTRSQIVRALAPGPLSVSDLSMAISRSKWATSQHLRVLREAGIVAAERRGRAVYYSLAKASATDTALAALNVVATAA